MLYRKEELIQWFEAHNIGLVADQLSMTEKGTLIEDQWYFDLNLITFLVEAWARPLLHVGANPVRIIRKMRAEIVGYLPNPREIVGFLPDPQ